MFIRSLINSNNNDTNPVNDNQGIVCVMNDEDRIICKFE